MSMSEKYRSGTTLGVVSERATTPSPVSSSSPTAAPTAIPKDITSDAPPELRERGVARATPLTGRSQLPIVIDSATGPSVYVASAAVGIEGESGKASVRGISDGEAGGQRVMATDHMPTSSRALLIQAAGMHLAAARGGGGGCSRVASAPHKDLASQT